MGLRISNLIDCSVCANYTNYKCNCTVEEIVEKYSLVGKQYALRCTEFTNEKKPITSEVSLDKALAFILENKKEFIIVSGKTGVKLRYKIEKKDKQDKKEFIYWLNTGEADGVLEYAGVLYFDSNDKQFKFGNGARGKLTTQDIKVKSILYLLNNLYNKNLAINIKVYKLEDLKS